MKHWIALTLVVVSLLVGPAALACGLFDEPCTCDASEAGLIHEHSHAENPIEYVGGVALSESFARYQAPPAVAQWLPPSVATAIDPPRFTHPGTLEPPPRLQLPYPPADRPTLT